MEIINSRDVILWRLYKWRLYIHTTKRTANLSARRSLINRRVVGNGMVGGGIFTRTPDGVRPGGDAHIPVAEWIIPTPPRGSVAAGIGAARAKRSTADSPTATAGSRAAQIKIVTISENVIFLMILWPKM